MRLTGRVCRVERAVRPLVEQNRRAAADMVALFEAEAAIQAKQEADSQYAPTAEESIVLWRAARVREIVEAVKERMKAERRARSGRTRQTDER